MRDRITASFVVLALAVLLGAGTVRAFTVRDLLREQESEHLNHSVVLIGAAVTDHRAAGQPVDREFLSTLLEPSARLKYVDPRGRSVVVRGADYTGDPETDLTLRSTTDDGTITLSRETQGLGDIFARDGGALITLIMLTVVLAGAAGWVAARSLAGPFQKLAVAAGALGRGRFDLDLPRTRIPEATAIAESLHTSALQLELRISREQAFAEHASHVLRTPLTALRLELEELTLRDDVPEDAKAAATRCIKSVDSVNTSAGELVALARRGNLVEGAEVSLHELARQIAQRWADRLAEGRRRLSASAEGDLDLVFTPGPVEHVLDLVLSDIVLGGKGPVKITFLGQDDHLKVTLPAGVIPSAARRRHRGRQPGAGLEAARTVVAAQGGRISGDGSAEPLEILLPRR